MLTTIPVQPLTTKLILDHGLRSFPDSEVVSVGPDGTCRHTPYREIGRRISRLASALAGRGIVPGDRVASLCFNGQEHLEMYFAVPGMGAALQTVNVRLDPMQTAFVIGEAAPRALFVDAPLVAGLAPIISGLTSVELVVVVGGPGDHAAGVVDCPTVDYEQLLAEGADAYPWPALEEDAPALISYTSGTTGDPKGVVYSHRARVLHTLVLCSNAALGLTEHDRALILVPMFHVFAWGMPYAAWLCGSDLVLPGRDLSAEAVGGLIEDERVTCVAGVPTLYIDLLRRMREHPVDLSTLRIAWAGGSALPAATRHAFAAVAGVDLVEGWGMTETSAVSSIAYPPKRSSEESAERWLSSSGRLMPGVEARIVDHDGAPVPFDGTSVGELQVRGPWVTGSYHGGVDQQQFVDGWMRTGDIGSIDDLGYLRVTDRLKDAIKSGGEWISSVELEGAIAAHPAVREVAVIGIPDDRFQERPCAVVVLEHSGPDVAKLRAFLRDRVARWWIPDAWVFVDALPRTSMGKYDKRALRKVHGSANAAPQ